MLCTRIQRVSLANLRRFSSGSIEWLQNRQDKKLASAIRKEVKKFTKIIEAGANSTKKVEALKKKVLTDYQFTLVEGEDSSDIKLEKDTGNETLTIDFDVWNPSEDDGEIQLFDVILKKKMESFPYFLVFTCSAHPMFSQLSVRTVPANGDYLDQDIYDGPELPNLSDNLQDALRKYLEDKGVNEEVSNFVRTYSVYRFNSQRLKRLELLAKSFTPANDS